jgi:hypothetical protein
MATAPEHYIAFKESFTRLLQSYNVETRVIVAGRPIDLWDLWHAVKKCDVSPARAVRPLHCSCQISYMICKMNDLSKFYMIATQLGVPTDPQTGQIALQQVKDLQEHYVRVCSVHEYVRNALAREPNSLPFDLAAPSPPPNVLLLQLLLRAYPFINFSIVTPDMIANLPYPQFETKMRSYLSHLPWPISSNGDNFFNDRQMAEQPSMEPTLDVKGIMSTHEQCQLVWRKVYDALRKSSDRLYCDRLTIITSSFYFPIAERYTALEEP